jgi:predicted phage-related endonuclease
VSTAMREVATWKDPDVRRSGIGGSDAAAAVGVSPFRTPLDLYLEKLGLGDPRETGEAAEWGTILEPVLLRQLAIREGVFVLGRDEFTNPVIFTPHGESESPFLGHHNLLGMLRHPRHVFMFSHVDAFVLDPSSRQPIGWVEGKTAGYWMGKSFGEDGTDQVPEDYLVQVHHTAEIIRALDYPTPCMMPVLIAGQRWKVYRPEIDPAVTKNLIALEAEFWRRVLEHDPPPATPDEAGRHALARLYPRDVGEEVTCPPGSDLDALARELAAARNAKAAAETEVARVENAIKERMKDAPKIVGDGWSISWRRSKDSPDTDWRAVAGALCAEFGIEDEDQSFIVDAHTQTKPGTRRFVPSLKKIGDTEDV